MTDTQTVDGDVTLTDAENTPAKVTKPENVHFLPESVDGDVKLINPEYVFKPSDGTEATTMEDPAVEYTGSVEDSYIETGSVTGDLIVENPEDVFFAHNAVNGSISIVGGEDTFTDPNGNEPNGDFPHEVGYWGQFNSFENPSDGIRVVGGRNEVTITELRDDVEVYVLGWNNDVAVNSERGTVNIHIVGSHNTVTADEYTELRVQTNAGVENTLTDKQFPTEELIETTKKEAFGDKTFGRHKVTYQKKAVDASYCKSCGEETETIIKRHQKDAFFLFGKPIYTYESTQGSHECVECSDVADLDAELTEEERKDIFN